MSSYECEISSVILAQDREKESLSFKPLPFPKALNVQHSLYIGNIYVQFIPKSPIYLLKKTLKFFYFSPAPNLAQIPIFFFFFSLELLQYPFPLLPFWPPIIALPHYCKSEFCKIKHVLNVPALSSPVVSHSTRYHTLIPFLGPQGCLSSGPYTYLIHYFISLSPSPCDV